MTASIKEYSGIPFDLALGEIYGLRLWKVDKYGRLRARNWSGAGPWRPGVNEAICLAESPHTNLKAIIDPSGKGRKAVHGEARQEQDYSPSVSPSPYSISAGYSTTRYRITWDDGSVETYNSVKYAPVEKHDAPSESCTCGFYAYTDPDHYELDGYRPGGSYVLGIAKATGRTLIGTKGFRAQKAEIVALLDPTAVTDYEPKEMARQKKLVARVYDVPLLPDRDALLEFAPIEPMIPDPSTDEFWALP